MLFRMKQESWACFSLEPLPWEMVAKSLSMNLNVLRQLSLTFSDLSVR